MVGRINKHRFFALRAVAVLAALLFLSACQSTGIKVLERSAPEKPVWANNSADFWKEGNFFYLKSVAEGADERNTRLLAMLRGKDDLARQIKSRLKNRFMRVTQGSHFGDIRTIQSVFYEQVDGIILTNVGTADEYTEKMLLKNGTEQEIFYRHYLLLQISQKDYVQAAADAFTQSAKVLPASEQLTQIGDAFWHNPAEK